MEPDAVRDGIAWGQWHNHRRKFHKMLDCGAYESAALMLVPDNCRVVVFFEDAADKAWKVGLSLRQGRFGQRGEQAFGATPALALCAASLRAIASQESSNGQ